MHGNLLLTPKKDSKVAFVDSSLLYSHIINILYFIHGNIKQRIAAFTYENCSIAHSDGNLDF